MATTVNKYIDSNDFLTASAVFDDVSLTIPSSDGYYQIDGIYRQQVSGLLLSGSSLCESCDGQDLRYNVTSGSDLCCVSGTIFTYYFSPGDSFTDPSTTLMYSDQALTTLAPDGFYNISPLGDYREQSSGVLGVLTSCPSCFTSTTVEYSSVSANDLCCGSPTSGTYYIDFGTTFLTTSNLYTDTLGTIAPNGFYKEILTNTYREMVLSVLDSQNPCNPCTTQSWRATECGGGGATYYLDESNGFDGSLSVILAYSYNIGDVVWVKQTSTGVITCAEIQSLSSTPPNYFIDEAANSGNGPYSNCVSCPIP